MNEARVWDWAKDVLEFVAPGMAVIGASVLEASPAGEQITRGELTTALVACFLASTSAYRSSRMRTAKRATKKPPDDEGQGGT